MSAGLAAPEVLRAGLPRRDASHRFDAWAGGWLRCAACRAGRQGSLRPALQSKMADLWSARAGYGLRDVYGDYGTVRLAMASRRTDWR